MTGKGPINIVSENSLGPVPVVLKLQAAWRSGDISVNRWGVSSPSLPFPFLPAEIEFGAFQTKNVTSGGKNVNDFSENQLTKSCAVYQNFVVIRLRMTQVEWRWSQKDGLNLRLFTATSSFIKPKSGCVTFHACLHCLFTICNWLMYEILAKTIVCHTNPTVKCCSFSSNTVSRLIKVQFTAEKIGTKNP